MPTTRSSQVPQSSQPLNLSPTARLHARFEQKRRDLISTGLYLGDPAFANSMDQRVVWRRVGREDRLVTKASADRFAAAQDALAARDSSGGSDREDDTSNELEQADLPELIDAKLSVVVFITPEDYWLISCGLWKGPTPACQDLADLKLTCTGAAPANEVFHDDFSVALANIRTLLQKVATPNFNNSNGVLVHGVGGIEKIKFRHVLFEPILDSEDGEDTEKGDNGSDTASETDDVANQPEFSIENWPAHHEAAKEALRSMIGTHKVNPLPAYDVRGNLIAPSQYRKYLEGATARITFTLHHWSITGPNRRASDTYVADIDSIRVLELPKNQGATTPRKRKTASKDPLEAEMSPTKKNKRGNNI